MPPDAGPVPDITAPAGCAPANAPAAEVATDLWLRLSIPATPGGVRGALLRLVAALAHRLDAGDLGRLELAIAELLNNIVEHAFAGRRPLPVDLAVRVGPDDIEVRIEDMGRAMPGGLPAPRDFPDLDRPQQDLPEGGFGWPMILALVDCISYRRIGAVNRHDFTMLRSTPNAALPQSCRNDSASLPEMSPNLTM
jgi:serine/threonine-protein kinase RsbW